MPGHDLVTYRKAMAINGEPREPRTPTTLYTWGVIRYDKGEITQNPTGVRPSQHEAMQEAGKALREADAAAVALVCTIPINQPFDLDYPAPGLVMTGTIDHVTGELVWTRER